LDWNNGEGLDHCEIQPSCGMEEESRDSQRHCKLSYTQLNWQPEEVLDLHGLVEQGTG